MLQSNLSVFDSLAPGHKVLPLFGWRGINVITLHVERVLMSVYSVKLRLVALVLHEERAHKQRTERSGRGFIGGG